DSEADNGHREDHMAQAFDTYRSCCAAFPVDSISFLHTQTVAYDLSACHNGPVPPNGLVDARRRRRARMTIFHPSAFILHPSILTPTNRYPLVESSKCFVA